MKKLLSATMFAFLMIAGFLPVSAQDGAPIGTPAAWNAAYFDNTFFLGSPVMTRLEGAIAHDWSTNAPDASVPADNFAVRWGADPYFAAGTYRFTTVVDDAVAVTLDFFNVIINTLDTPQPGATLTAEVSLTEGVHHVQVDFLEFAGDAFVYVAWELVDAPAAADAVPAAPPPTLPDDEPAAYVTANRLNVRSGPGINHRVVGQFVFHTVVTPIGRSLDNLWVQVRQEDGTPGWVSAAWLVTNRPVESLPLVLDTPLDTPAVDEVDGIMITRVAVLRLQPETTATVVAVIRHDEQLTVLGRDTEGTWLKVRLPNGDEGWVRVRNIEISVPVDDLAVVE